MYSVFLCFISRWCTLHPSYSGSPTFSQFGYIVLVICWNFVSLIKELHRSSMHFVHIAGSYSFPSNTQSISQASLLLWTSGSWCLYGCTHASFTDPFRFTRSILGFHVLLTDLPSFCLAYSKTSLTYSFIFSFSPCSCKRAYMVHRSRSSTIPQLVPQGAWTPFLTFDFEHANCWMSPSYSVWLCQLTWKHLFTFVATPRIDLVL